MDDAAAKKQRTADLEAERQGIEAEMSKVQTTGRLSALNSRVAEIVEEIKQLGSSKEPDEAAAKPFTIGGSGVGGGDPLG